MTKLEEFANEVGLDIKNIKLELAQKENKGTATVDFANLSDEQTNALVKVINSKLSKIGFDPEYLGYPFTIYDAMETIVSFDGLLLERDQLIDKLRIELSNVKQNLAALEAKLK